MTGRAEAGVLTSATLASASTWIESTEHASITYWLMETDDWLGLLTNVAMAWSAENRGCYFLSWNCSILIISRIISVVTLLWYFGICFLCSV